jgi:hypothetical protein
MDARTGGKISRGANKSRDVGRNRDTSNNSVAMNLLCLSESLKYSLSLTKI